MGAWGLGGVEERDLEALEGDDTEKQARRAPGGGAPGAGGREFALGNTEQRACRNPGAKTADIRRPGRWRVVTQGGACAGRDIGTRGRARAPGRGTPPGSASARGLAAAASPTIAEAPGRGAGKGGNAGPARLSGCGDATARMEPNVRFWITERQVRLGPRAAGSREGAGRDVCVKSRAGGMTLGRPRGHATSFPTFGLRQATKGKPKLAGYRRPGLLPVCHFYPRPG